jgi:transcriptional regulator with XRE-family HTH domain
MTGIKQQAISRLENPYYGKPTLTTLKKIAAAFDVGLLVEFVPFSQLINRVSGTPYIEHGFSPETMSVPTFEEEDEQNTFEPKDDTLSLLEQSAQIGSSRGLGNITWQCGNGTEMPFDLRTVRQGKKPPLPFRPQGGIGGLGKQEQISMGRVQ